MKTWLERCKDPRWQKKRLKVLNRDEFRCQLCWDKKDTLHVHHKYYKRNKDPWQYPMKALITLCERCHDEVSKFIKFGYRYKNQEENIQTIKRHTEEEYAEIRKNGISKIKKILSKHKKEHK